MYLLLFLLVLLCPAPVAALTLVEVLSFVYDNDPRLQASRSNARAADEMLAIARSGFRPSLSASGSSDLRYIENNADQHDLMTLRSSVTVDQNLYRGGGRRAEIKRARSQIAATHEQLRDIEQNVFIDAIEAYLSVQRDEAVLQAAVANQNRLARQLQAAEDRFEFGEVTRTDVAQAEARQAASDADRIEAESNLAVSKSQFEDRVGMKPHDLTKPDLPNQLPNELPEALAFSEDVPRVRVAELALEAAKFNIDAETATILPRIDVRGEASHVEDPSRSIDSQRELVASASVTIPLFQSGAEYARVRQAKQTAIENRYLVDDTLRAVKQAITGRWLELKSTTARLRSIDTQVRAAEIALEGVREEALVGARTILDILDQEQELFVSEVERARIRFDQMLAAFNLKAATGQLSAVDLGLNVEFYDPLTNLRYTEGRWVGIDVRAVK